MLHIGFLLVFFVYHLNAQDFYKAAVVNYKPVDTKDSYLSPKSYIESNLNKYLEIIQKAKNKGAKIVIFPENGLTSYGKLSAQTLKNFSTKIFKMSTPCSQKSVPEVHLKKLSCAAKENYIFLVINLLEYDDNKYFSTNIVFHPNGTIISRYRKQNLNDEQHYSTGNAPGFFNTDYKDFKVKFGMLLGNDIMNVTTLQHLKDRNVRNIIFSSSWKFPTPILSSLSFLPGYAVFTDVNVLAAGYSGVTGSGIFCANGSIPDLLSHADEKQGYSLIIQNVPIFKADVVVLPQKPVVIQGRRLINEAATFRVTNLTNYELTQLNGTNTVVKKCFNNTSFCCNFHISFEDNYRNIHDYKLLLYHGKNNKSQMISTCGLIICPNPKAAGNICVTPNDLSMARFRNISISTSVIGNDFVVPVSLRTDATPADEYMFSKEHNEVKVHLLRASDSVVNFGFYTVSCASLSHPAFVFALGVFWNFLIVASLY